METNFFSALWITQAALPYMREQRSGTSYRYRQWTGSVPSSSGTPQGDPVATAQAILTVVDAPTPPLRSFLVLLFLVSFALLMSSCSRPGSNGTKLPEPRKATNPCAEHDKTGVPPLSGAPVFYS